MTPFFDWLDLFLEMNGGAIGAVLCIIGMFAMGVAAVEWDINAKDKR